MTPKNVQIPNPNPKYKPPGMPAEGRGGNLMDKESLAKMAQASLDDAMEMVDNHMEATNSWIPFYVGKAWAHLELLRKLEKEET